MNYSVMTEREVEIELSTSASEGLESFTAHDRLIDNGRNLPEKNYAKSSARVVLTQITNLYTIAFFVMGIITAMCDFSEGIWAWVIFFAVAVINMVSGFLRDNRERKIAVDFDRKRSQDCMVIRDGKEALIDPTLLVKGDIVVLGEGDFVPADIRILKCENLKADESIFVGRNLPVEKQGERAKDDVDVSMAPNMLYCGTSVVNGNCVGAVTAVGKDTTIAKIRSEKSGKLDMHDKFAKSAKSEKLLLLAALICAAVVLCFVAINEKSTAQGLLKACTVALCLIPAPVCLVRMIAIRLYNREIENLSVVLPDDDFSYQIGNVHYLVFDKGGVVTNGEMELEDRVVSGRDKIEMAVICSDCEFVNSNLTGSDIDRATVRALMNDGVDAKRVIEENERILFMPFDEARKLMAVVIKKGDGYRIIVKGSVDVIPTLCSHIADGDDVTEMSGEALHRLENISSAMAEKGLKIRAVAFRDFKELPENIEDEIKDLIFAGALGYREVMVRKTREAVKSLRSFFVKPIMVSGDHTITAAALARQAGIIKKESECISFRELGDCTDEELCKAAENYSVFTGATVSDREKLMRALSANSSAAVSGEQMCEHSVAINAQFAIGNSDECAVKTEKSDISTVSEVICKAKEMRGNLAFSSLLAISVGLCEALGIMFMILTGADKGIKPLDMLIANLFTAFVPCMIVCMFASVKFDMRNRELLALKCAVEGFIGAIAFLCSGGSIVLFAVYYALADAVRMCASYKNFEKGSRGIKGIAIAISALAVVLVRLAVENALSINELWYAIGAVIVSAILSKINIKGREEDV